MKIAFDYQAFTFQSYGGISRYFSILSKELYKQHQNVKIFTGFHQNNYLRELPVDMVKGNWIRKYPPKSSRLIKIFNHAITSIQISSWKPDVIHETYYPSLPVNRTNALRLATVYDMIHELFSAQFPTGYKTTKCKKATFSRVDHILSISHSTKRDLVELFGIDEKKITVVHLGVDLEAFGAGQLKLSTFTRPFILYVGDRNDYKNFSGFMKSFASSSILKNEVDIVAFGRDKFKLEELEFIKRLGLRESQVHQVSGGDDVLSALYHQAVAFVYPSLYEGFGLPPLEAMAAGCPVISSNTSSMPEVIGQAGEYFDPYNLEGMRNAIEKVVFSDDLKNGLIKKGFENIKNFSWEKCGVETLSVYRSLIGNNA